MYSCVIVAAGKGTRSESEIPKLLNKVNSKEIYLYSVELFLKMGFEVILVINEDIKIKGVQVVPGGNTRSLSVYNGLLKASGEYVFIHDAARPLINEKMVNLLISQINPNQGVFLSKRVYNSLKKVKDNKILTVDRSNYIEAETPQVFKKDILLEAFNKREKDYPDEVSLVKDVLNIDSKPVIHDGFNLKYTTKHDLETIKAILENKQYRIGKSFDIHRLEKNRDLILGGVKIDYELGLLGHSDADVLLHVVTESILGALGLGDLGDNYPDTDIKYENISSAELLNDTLGKMHNKGFIIENIDLLIYAEKPNLTNYKEKIRKNVSKLLEVSLDQVNLKATTTEKIGPIGANEAIAAEAVVLLKRR